MAIVPVNMANHFFCPRSYKTNLKEVLSNVFLCVSYKSLGTTFVAGGITGKLTSSALI